MKKRAQGRPRIAKSDRKRNNVTIRMRDARKAELEKEASANQRSLSEEIEHQLEERALLREIMPALAGPMLVWLMQQIGHTLQVIEQRRGNAWDEDPETLEECVNSVVRVLLVTGQRNFGLADEAFRWLKIAEAAIPRGDEERARSTNDAAQPAPTRSSASRAIGASLGALASFERILESQSSQRRKRPRTKEKQP